MIVLLLFLLSGYCIFTGCSGFLLTLNAIRSMKQSFGIRYTFSKLHQSVQPKSIYIDLIHGGFNQSDWAESISLLQPPQENLSIINNRKFRRNIFFNFGMIVVLSLFHLLIKSKALIGDTNSLIEFPMLKFVQLVFSFSFLGLIPFKSKLIV